MLLSVKILSLSFSIFKTSVIFSRCTHSRLGTQTPPMASWLPKSFFQLRSLLNSKFKLFPFQCLTGISNWIEQFQNQTHLSSYNFESVSPLQSSCHCLSSFSSAFLFRFTPKDYSKSATCPQLTPFNLMVEWPCWKVNIIWSWYF